MIRLKLASSILTLIILISACTEAPAATIPGAQPGPTAPPTLADACVVADDFLKGWETKDFAAMYKLISPKSQQLSQTQFSAIYTDAEQKLANSAKTHTLNCDNAITQGTTAAITYDMKFTGATLGDFTDPARTMRLTLTPNGWRVAWSTMDIFEGMAGGTRLDLKQTPASRGTIYDRTGKPLAQDNQVLYTAKLFTRVYPGNPDQCFAYIANVFKQRYTDVKADYGPFTGLDYGYTIGNLDEGTYTARRGDIDKFCKVTWDKHTTRVYRANGLASQMLGYIGQITPDQQDRFAGYPQGALIGQAGIEAKYERQLAGLPGAELTLRTSTGTLIRSIRKTESSSAQDVRTTLDGDLQVAVEQAISDAYNYAQNSWGQFSTGAAAIVMDVNTGQILALASYPTFDVDVFNSDTRLETTKLLTRIVSAGNPNKSPQKNRVSQEYSALASVMKIVSMAAAADSGTVKPTDTYTCKGTYNGAALGDTQGTRVDWIYTDPWYKQQGKNFHGDITLTQALTASCDVYFWQVGGLLNKKDPNLLPSYMAKMGLGKVTGSNDLDELKGQIPSPDNIAELTKTEGRRWTAADALNIVIGQGDVLVTPLQVAHMMVAIANGGTFYKPYFVDSVGSVQQMSYTAKPEAQGKMEVDPKVLEAVRKGLCGVTMDPDLGTAHWFLSDWKFDKISFCGKTGTAQTGSAYPNGWFAAFAGPAGKPPEIAIVALVERGREGSETAGPIVRRIVESYYKIPYANYPQFWSEAYVPLADPNAVSDGGRH